MSPIAHIVCLFALFSVCSEGQSIPNVNSLLNDLTFEELEALNDQVVKCYKESQVYHIASMTYKLNCSNVSNCTNTQVVLGSTSIALADLPINVYNPSSSETIRQYLLRNCNINGYTIDGVLYPPVATSTRPPGC